MENIWTPGRPPLHLPSEAISSACQFWRTADFQNNEYWKKQIENKFGVSISSRLLQKAHPKMILGVLTRMKQHDNSLAAVYNNAHADKIIYEFNRKFKSFYRFIFVG